ncbi:GrpB family protein [Pseudomonas panipatensis]|uniref:GrpB domain, predicted nucleotidyltransferase, UPF0157 family n=1 Tax=Pseudomonas panipatensis TaxID=428992 RepID=A0A1G8HEV3_9PSED|nr:GrpB family protein [Pseudomonas panipatensis]SDI05115.1 GrpB domain, predicted nucleotidyltransferase, UPF0157 family [Pseudomonas panipatensis]SMP57850.1 GrpB domain, predicted nucleotidyltransferase, UPF0157 family [Pseudomonas panipatensis]
MDTPIAEPSFDGQRWSNAEADRVELADADPRWPQRFREESHRIAEALQLPGLVIEHIGSTAVPGLKSKPIIDILLLPPPACDWPRLIAPLEALDYQYWRDNPAPQRMFFVKGMPPKGQGRTHHIHVMPRADAERYLVFRNWLRSHPECAADYQHCKESLAALHPTDREAYTRGKSAIVAHILGKAMSQPQSGQT